jgi:hypothetical protein
MSIVWLLLAIQGAIGAFDTLYYHEWRARLAANPDAAPELRLHAVRSFFYALLFGTLPWLEWHGLLVLVLAGVMLAEIVLTMLDFVVEKTVRKSLGDVFAGERVTHAVMAIVYGAMAANLLPAMWRWWHEPTGFTATTVDVPVLSWLLTAMAAGVFLSGARDLYAALGLPGGGWPWRAGAA